MPSSSTSAPAARASSSSRSFTSPQSTSSLQSVLSRSTTTTSCRSLTPVRAEPSSSRRRGAAPSSAPPSPGGPTTRSPGRCCGSCSRSRSPGRATPRARSGPARWPRRRTCCGRRSARSRARRRRDPSRARRRAEAQWCLPRRSRRPTYRIATDLIGLAWIGPMIQLSTSSGVPIFKQIYDQIVYMIEAGQLADGDGLPSSRMLAANLHVNRNTVARAYGELRDRGYIESRRRNGMVVSGAESVRREAVRHEEAQRVLNEAVTQCVELGLSADEIATIAYHESLHAKNDSLRLLFVECNVARAEEFASKLSERLEMPVEPLVLGELEPDDLGGADLVITTFFHLSEVRALARETSTEVLAIVVAPHVQTLVKLAQIPKNKRIGILYWTQDQAETIRQSLVDTGLGRIEVLGSASADELEGIDLLVMPSENPELREQVGDAVPVVEYGNVLGEASVRMVLDVLDDLRGRRLRSVA